MIILAVMSEERGDIDDILYDEIIYNKSDSQQILLQSEDTADKTAEVPDLIEKAHDGTKTNSLSQSRVRQQVGSFCLAYVWYNIILYNYIICNYVNK